MEETVFVAQNNDDVLRITLLGEWSTPTLKSKMDALNSTVNSASVCRVRIDFSNLTSLDSASALFFKGLKQNNAKVRLLGFSPKARSLFRLIVRHTRAKSEYNDTIKRTVLDSLGYRVHSKISDFLSYAEFFGRLIIYSKGLFKGRNFRLRSVVKHIETSSITALPIVALSAFLIGVVVTYQGALQLERFGAAIFTVDLAGISITRELAPLLTAVVIAGRSGASYTSEIGVMKITEEIDAMRAMGLSPYYFLAFPRILALTFTLWLVIFFADAVAIMGAMVVAKLQLEISYSEFLDRLHTTLALKHILVGVLKAPFFAFLIASIGIFRGLQVQKNSESIGIMTTHSVVNSIFAVIACDALFAVMFTRLGI
ncbi:MAG TPA: ABC transporter permease [Campylobacterales bacterium]|nr:ABC transporter permease [Campylobacterales bacterium]